MTRFVSLALFSSLVLVIARPAPAQCADWTQGFGLPGTDGAVKALAVFDDGSGPALYVGGTFTRAGGRPAKSLARWDGVQWTNMGAAFANGGVDPDIRALAVFDDGAGAKLYAAGVFGAPGSSVARWDGATWSNASNGFTAAARVDALAVHDDGSGPALYAGGRLLGGLSNGACVAKWSGASWSPLGAGFDPPWLQVGDAECYALASFDDGSGPGLYAGGEFTAHGVLGTYSLAKWSGASWSPVGGGTNASTGSVHALAAYDDGSGRALYIGGDIDQLGGVATAGIGRWNGSTFAPVGGGLGIGAYVGTARALAVVDLGSGPTLFVGGTFDRCGGSPARDVAQWTGAWSAVGAGTYGLSVSASPLAFAGFDDGSGAKLFCGGSFQIAGDSAAFHIATWDRTRWAAIDIGAGALDSVFALCATDAGPDGHALYAGGQFPSIGSVSTYGVARWDGALWHALAGGVDAPVNAMTMFDDGSGAALFVGGNFTHTGEGPASHVARWDGAHWAALGSGVAGSVHALCVFDDGSGPALYAGGKFTLAGSVAANNVARWNGTAWSALGSGTSTLSTHAIDALAVFDDGSGPALYAGGSFTTAGGLASPNLARWDGASWSAIGADGVVSALLVHDAGTGPALYAAGRFQNIGGVAASRIARWDGVAWTPLGAGTNLRVYSLASFADQPGSPAQLFAGGDFTSAGGVAASRIARWDGSSWSALGGGVTDSVYALAEFDDPSTPWKELYVGGLFDKAGGRISVHLARWANACACAATTYCTAGTTSSGCVPSISGTGAASASAPSGFTIRVDDVEGQKQGYVFYGVNGALANPWSPLSSSFLCVKAPTQRTPLQNSGGTNGACDGVMSIDWNDYIATHPGALGTPLVAGTQVWAQLYFRDPPAPKTTNLSNALTFFVCP